MSNQIVRTIVVITILPMCMFLLLYVYDILLCCIIEYAIVLEFSNKSTDATWRLSATHTLCYLVSRKYVIYFKLFPIQICAGSRPPPYAAKCQMSPT